MSGASPLRVAIVGCGPKGLYALERLLAHSRAEDPSPISVDIYEPHSTPGAGPVYDPGQPEYLRMNFAADMVDMWPARNRDPARLSFSEWRSALASESQEAYPSRALVGRYLSDGFQKLVAGAPDAMKVQHISERAQRVIQTDDAWTIAANEDRRYHEVLIATGHEGYAIFPVDHYLSPQRVPPGSVVAIRGFALTMIDASLALTEGRGGRFHSGREPHLFEYEGSNDDVAVIRPWSRTGRPMLAKPDPTLAVEFAGLDEIAADGSAAIAALPPGSPFNSAAAIVADVAERSLRSTRASNSAVDEVGRRMEIATGGGILSSESTPAEDIERSIAVGVGRGDPGADWALGHAWRATYPALVARLGANGLAGEEWPAFRHLAYEMERISFGPPPVNAAKLLALIECGKFDLSCLTHGAVPEADLELDCVIPAPGVPGGRESLLAALVRGGHARIPPARRGVELTPDVTCVGADGRPSEGLSAIGRPTEDWVIGNDTLNRALHPQPDIWARRVVVRAARR